MATDVKNIICLLNKLEQQLQLCGWWQNQLPPASALASQQPFCCDTLTFAQWLQFVFIPKVELLIEQNAQLPGNIALAPMGEMTFNQHSKAVVELHVILKEIDAAFGDDQ